MNDEYVFEALDDTAKKIADLKEFHIAVALKLIDDYQRAGAQEHFIAQQRAQLKKLYARVAELEAKAERLLQHLE